MSLYSLGKKEMLQTEKSNLQKLKQLKITRSVGDGRLTRENHVEENIAAFPQPANIPEIEEATLLNQNSNILNALVQYIPTESVTLYIATMSALEAVNSVFSISVESIYWFFCILTPILFFSIYVGERKSSELSPFPRWKKWPWWKLLLLPLQLGL